MGKGVRVGLDSIYYAIMTDETDEIYDTPNRLAGAISATITPTTNSETLYADDQADEVANSLGDITVELNVKDLPPAILADLIGSKVDANGVLLENKNDYAPYIALGFRSRKSNGKFRYYWLYKGKFQPTEEEFQTKEDTPSFQTPTITGTFLPRAKDGQWRARVDSDDPMVPASVISNWFAAVYETTSDTTPPTVATVPASGATGVAVSTKPKWTFSEAIRSSSVTAANFIVQKADGSAVVDGTLSLNAAGTEVTFTPAANLTAATAYMTIATTGIKDLAGNALAAPKVTTFTTA